LIHVVHAILHAQYESVPRKQWRNGASGHCIVRGFHAKEDDLRAAHGANFCGSFYAHFFLELKGIQEEAVLLNSFNEGRAPDHRNGSACAREQTAKVSADGPRADNRNPGPGS
jgi:hypothetical protein